ncbi:MAG: MMPL family transporter [Gammaproteobacteria bacterium]|nr:MMPL family transporter [Gammaproteobacteria bacterium]
MVKKLLNLSYSYPKTIILLLIALTVSVAPMLPRLQFDISAQSLMVKSDPDWISYQKSLLDFGSDSAIIVVMSDDQLFSPDKLLLIKKSLRKLKQLEFVKGTSSLFNVPNVKEIEGYIETKPFLLEFPQTEEQKNQLLDDALANEMVAGNLVSDDRNTMAINLFIDDTTHYPGRDSEMIRAINEILNPLKNELAIVYQMSAPFVREEISQQIQLDLLNILPAALVVLLVVLGLSMGRLNCSIVPLTSATISIVMTLSYMAFMEIPINVLTSIIPALLIIIGSTEDVHLMAEYHSGIRSGLSRDEAVQRLPVNQGMAILLAFITTFTGFLSITVNKLELLREFGWLVAFGLLINFMVTILFVPAYLRLFGGTGVGLTNRKNIFQIMANAVFSVVIRLKKTTLLFVLLIAGYFAWGSQYLQVNNNTLAYFAEDSEIRLRADQIHSSLAGMQTFSIILDSSIEGTFQKVRYLTDIEKIQQFIADQGVFDKTTSFADFIKLTNQVMEGTSAPELPLDDEVVGVYMEFVQFESVSSYVNPDYSSARILVRHNIGSSNVLKQEFEKIRQFVEYDLRSSLKLVLTGESVLNNNAADAMAMGQIQSLILMVGVILFLVSLLFVDIRAGLIALVPNVFPVIVLFGVMGYFNIPLDSGTTMVAVIALGISVDDTIHFLSRYHFFTRGNNNVEEALRKTIQHEATPIITTSLALALGFSTLMLSSFQPVVYFGALSALVMVLAMLSTFILTPILLSFTRLVTVWDMLSLNLKSDVLSNSRIFNGLKNFEIKQAILSGTIKNVSTGEVIIDQGLDGEEFYVLLKGSATATHRDADGSIHTVGYMQAGDLFGEVAQLSQHGRLARVTAKERTQLLEMKWDNIRRLGRFHPRIAMRLYHNLAKILSQRIAINTVEKDSPHDELTGVLTKPFLCEMLNQAERRSKHFSESISLILLDIDIKPLHDELPVDLHDSIVLSITETIQKIIRPADVLARWATCSFMMLLPRTMSSDAVELAEKIKVTIDNAEITTKARVEINAVVTEVLNSDSGKGAIERLESNLLESKLHQNNFGISVT